MNLKISKKVAGTEDHFLANGSVETENGIIKVGNAVVKQTGAVAQLVTVPDVETTFGENKVKGYKTASGEPVICELPSDEPLKPKSEVEFHGFSIVHSLTKK